MNRVKRKNVKENSSVNKSIITSNKSVPTNSTVETQIDFPKFDESYLYSDEMISNELDKDYKKKYTAALEFINHCHVLMNRLLIIKSKEMGDTKCKIIDSFKFPEICNYLSVFETYLTRFQTKTNSDFNINHYNNNSSNAGKPILKNQVKNSWECTQGKPRTKYSESNTNYVEEKIGRNNKNYRPAVEKTSVQKRLLSNQIKQSNNVQHAVKHTESLNHVSQIKSSNNINKEPNLINKRSQLLTKILDTKLNKNPELIDLPEHLDLPDVPLQSTQKKPPVPEFEKEGYDNYIVNIIHEHIKHYLNNNTPNYELNNISSKESIIIDNFALPTKQEVNIDNYRNYSEVSPTKSSKSDKKIELVCTKSCSNIPPPSINKTRKTSRLNSPVKSTSSNTKSKTDMKDELFVGNNDYIFGDNNSGEESIICSDVDLTANCEQNTSLDATDEMGNWTENGNPQSAESFPFKLNEKDIHMINEKVLETIGLFTKNFEMRPEVVDYLERVKYLSSTNEKNRQFRTIRSEYKPEDIDCATVISSESSDIRSESDIKSVHRED